MIELEAIERLRECHNQKAVYPKHLEEEKKKKTPNRNNKIRVIDCRKSAHSSPSCILDAQS